MKKYYLISLMLIFFPCFSFAGAYVEPVNVNTDNWSITEITQKIAAWTESENALNPCYGTHECYIGPDVQYPDHAPGLGSTCNTYDNCVEISKLRTAREVLAAYSKKHPIPYTAVFDILPVQATCVGLFYMTHAPKDGLNDAKLWPGSTCGILPPENEVCNLNLPDKINFGSISADMINGREKHAQGSIYCSESAHMKIYAFSTTNTKGLKFNKDGTFTGNLFINGEDAFTGASIKVPASPAGKEGDMHFDLSVVLNATKNVNAGNYSAVAVVIAAFE